MRPGEFWQPNPIYNELQFSPFHMNEASLGAYVTALRKYRPQYLHGYPSAISMLAEYVQRYGLSSSLPPINAALLGSEDTTDIQRLRIQEAFRTRVFTWYGHSERVVLAGECEQNSTYHQFPDYGYLEIIDDGGGRILQDGDRGEIVGTGFLNRVMPLIRYRTGDYATLLQPRCACGRCWDRFCDVDGRWKQEFVVTKSGGQISLTALNMHGPLFDHVVRYQYRQSEIGKCEICLVVAPGFTDADRQAIEDAYQRKAGDEVEFMVGIVDSIPLTNRGKLRRLVSELHGKALSNKPDQRN
jgi:phenylacetate-CoA ligase